MDKKSKEIKLHGLESLKMLYGSSENSSSLNDNEKELPKPRSNLKLHHGDKNSLKIDASKSWGEPKGIQTNKAGKGKPPCQLLEKSTPTKPK